MTKVKSVKFYNFTLLPNSGGITICVKFYDLLKKLLPIDLSNCLSSNYGIYYETSEYVISCNRSNASGGISNYCYQSFHIGNFDKTFDIPIIGYCWVPLDYSAIPEDYIKIEFKIPQYFSDIKILHTYCNTHGFNTCSYDIEFEDGITESYNYTSNGKHSPYSLRQMEDKSYDQDILNSWFDSIEFSKSKQIYDSEIGYVETLDTNNFRNIPVNTVEKLKVLYTKSSGTLMSCIVSFDQKQTWKSFNGTNWVDIADNSAQNIILNCMDIEKLNQLDKNKLIAGGFTGDLDFKIAMKSNDTEKTPSITKIYIEYK